MEATLHLSQSELIHVIETGVLLDLAKQVETLHKSEEMRGVNALDAQTAKETPVAETRKDTAPAKETASPEKTVTLEELRRAFQEKNSEQNRPKLKDILHQNGAKTLSNLSPERYAAVLREVNELAV